MFIFSENKDLYIPFLNSPKHSLALYKIKQRTIEKLVEKTVDKNIPEIIAKSVISFMVCGIIGVLEQNKFDEITPEVTSVLTDKIQNGFIYSKDV